MASRFGQGRGGAPAANTKKGRFAGVVPGGGRRRQLPYGNYVVEIEDSERRTLQGDTFVANFKVLESDVAHVKPGAQFSYVQSMKDTWGTGAGKVLDFVIACGNCDDEQIEEIMAEANAEPPVSIVDAACGAAEAVAKHGENPLAGCKVRVFTSQGQPDQQGGHYTDHAWSPFEE